MTAPTGPALRDIHLPVEPSWWPPAPGWWALAFLAMALLAYLLWRVLRQRRMMHARLALRREFERACATSGVAQVAALSELLRRAALRYAPASAVLRDEDWLAFLDADDVAQPFRRGPGRLLLDGPYRAHVDDVEAAALARAVRQRLDRFVTRDRPFPAPGKSAHPELVEGRDIRTSCTQPLPAPGLRDIRTSCTHV